MEKERVKESLDQRTKGSKYEVELCAQENETLIYAETSRDGERRDLHSAKKIKKTKSREWKMEIL